MNLLGQLLDHLVDLLLVEAQISRANVDKEDKSTNNRKCLEEVVFGKVLLRMVLMERPKVVDQNVKDRQNDDKEDSAVLGLETNDDHDGCDGSNDGYKDSPESKFTRENEADKQENQENTSTQLDIHLLVTLVQSWKSSSHQSLSDPRFGQNEQKTTDDRQISKKEVEIKDESITNALHEDDSHQNSGSVFGLTASNHIYRGHGHGNDVEDQE